VTAPSRGLRSRDELGHEPLESRVKRWNGGGPEVVRIVDENIVADSEQVAVLV
jgi:hypothetical protein